uniref:Uncharacterized protein n=1 Tax=Oryzias latipes TaxID=8090 RepID=A0A3P9LP76_ORYLA
MGCRDPASHRSINKTLINGKYLYFSTFFEGPKHFTVTQKPQLSVCNKLCFAIGGAPYQITGCALGFFLQIFLLEVAQLDPLDASIILFAGRAWDGITDPIVGFLVSHSRWTRVGRMMPW